MFRSVARVAMTFRTNHLRSKSAALAGAFLFSLIAAPLSAADSPFKGTDLEKIIREVSKRQKAVTTLQADFKQVKEMALLAAPEVSTGQFIYSKPNKVLWNYQSPMKVQMLIANGRLTTYYPALKKAETLEVKRFEERIFRYMGATGAMDELAKFFDFRFVDTKADHFYTLELKPKTKVVARRVRRIQIWIEKETYLASKFEYVEGDGDLTRYEFTNVRINAPVAESTFALQLPPGVRLQKIKLN